MSAVPTLWPKQWVWTNYAEAMRMAPLMRYILNTLIATAGIMALQITIGILAAYGFAVGNFPGKNILFTLVLGGLMVPLQVTFIPIYTMMAELKWLDTFLALIVPNAVSAYFIFMLRQAFMSVDKSYIEAAQIDGMGRLGIIFRILTPMCRPTVITLTVITFIDSWNSYFWPKIVTKVPEMRVISLGVYELKRSYAGMETMNTNQIMAGAVIAILPIVILFLVLQKYIITGMSTAAMK